MLQDLHTPSALDNADDETPPSASVTRSPAPHPFSANTYAERLMDELFEDVEQLLDLGTPTAIAAPAPAPPDPEPFEQPFPATEVRADLEPAMPLATRPDAIVLQPTEALVEPIPAAVMQIAPDTPAPAVMPQSAPQRAWERFLLAVGCVSVVVTLGLWLLYLDSKQQQPITGIAPVGAGATASVADQQFAAYVQKALQNITSQPQATVGVVPPEKGVTVPGMPTVVVPQTPGAPSPGGVNPAGTGSERVYVPVYQLPPNLYPPGSAVAPLPNLPKSGKPAPGVAHSPQASTPNSAGVVRRLVGVLEQGNGSVALFEVNGVTQRYELGESIGSSGWTLVEVSKNQAIIRRNGDVRSLFVGHSF